MFAEGLTGRGVAMQTSIVFPSCHTQTPDGAVIHARKRLHGRERWVQFAIEFDRLGIARGGLLDSVIQGMDCPIGASNVAAFVRVLRGSGPHLTFRQILGKPAHLLTTPEIHLMYCFVEEQVSQWGGSSHYMQAFQARKIFEYCQHKLADGTAIEDVGFCSRFDTPGERKEKDWTGFCIPDHPNPALRKPVSAIVEFDDLENLRIKAKDNVEGIRDYICQKCTETLDAHEALVNTLLATKCEGTSKLPARVARTLENGGNLSVRLFRQLPEEQRFRVALYMIERDQLYIRPPKKTLYLTRLSALYPLSHVQTNRVMFGAALSDYYLPRLAVVACILLIAVDTGWNSETILSMRPEDVVATETGILLIGIKGRTEKRQYSLTVTNTDADSANEVDATDRDINNPLTIRAVQLLLAHQRRVRLFMGKDEASMFATLNLTLKREDLIFQIPNLHSALHEFCDFHQLPRFCFIKLRDLAAHVDYLSPDGSIYTVNAFLNQKDLVTTSIYIHSTITRSLHEANILRYMKKLAATILFDCGREEIIEKKKIDKRLIDTKILFPASPMQAEETRSRIDDWIDSGGQLQLTIGETEIRHCALQYQYYKKNFHILLNANSERFIYRHLPRIVATIAMRRVIEASRHKAVLTRFEATIHGTPL